MSIDRIAGILQRTREEARLIWRDSHNPQQTLESIREVYVKSLADIQDSVPDTNRISRTLMKTREYVSKVCESDAIATLNKQINLYELFFEYAQNAIQNTVEKRIGVSKRFSDPLQQFYVNNNSMIKQSEFDKIRLASEAQTRKENEALLKSGSLLALALAGAIYMVSPDTQILIASMVTVVTVPMIGALLNRGKGLTMLPVDANKELRRIL